MPFTFINRQRTDAARYALHNLCARGKPLAETWANAGGAQDIVLDRQTTINVERIGRLC